MGWHELQGGQGFWLLGGLAGARQQPAIHASRNRLQPFVSRASDHNLQTPALCCPACLAVCLHLPCAHHLPPPLLTTPSPAAETSPTTAYRAPSPPHGTACPRCAASTCSPATHRLAPRRQLAPHSESVQRETCCVSASCLTTKASARVRPTRMMAAAAAASQWQRWQCRLRLWVQQ